MKVILGWCKEFARYGRYPEGFNCLNIISYIYNMLPDEFHSEVAKEFGSYLDREGIRDSLPLFNIRKLFGIFPHMPETTRDSILCSLVGSFFLEGCKSAALLSKLIERSDLVGPESKKELNDHLTELLISGEPEIAKDVIEIIRKNEIAAKNLLEQRTIFKLMEKMERIREIENRQRRIGEPPPQVQPVTVPGVGTPVRVVTASTNLHCCLSDDLITPGQQVLECPFCKVMFHEQCARVKNIQHCPVCGRAITMP